LAKALVQQARVFGDLDRQEEVVSQFCLVEAPDADAAFRPHREAHGLVADRIFEGVEGA
jgi:hypothetical protein